MHKFEEFNDETLGLIAKINDYEAYWGTNGTMHYIKFCRGGKVARFSIFTGKQIIVDSQYIEVPQKVFNALQKVTTTDISGMKYWDVIIQRINEANNDVKNYKMVNSKECPKFYCVKKPGPKSKLSRKRVI